MPTSSPTRVRLGVVGCGVIGTQHLKAAVTSPLCHVVAIADLRPDALAEAGDRFNVRRRFAQGADLIASADVDAVVLAFPTATRTSMAISALRQGKHVLIEKPVTADVTDLRAVLAARGDRVAACASSRFRCYPAARAATDFVATGALGTIRVLRARGIAPAAARPEQFRPDWRLSRSLNGGGYLVNWGVYDIDYLLGVTGWTLRPVAASGQMWTIPPAFATHVTPNTDAETHYAALVRFAGGAVMTLERAEYVAAAPDDAWEIIGDRGSLSLRMLQDRPESTLTFHRADPDRGTVAEVVWSGPKPTMSVHAGPVLDFVESIAEGRTPLTSLDHALPTTQIIQAIYTAARTGREATIEQEATERP